MGSDNSKDRFDGAKTLLDWGFANYTTMTPEIDTALITDVSVRKGREEWIQPQLAPVDPVLVKKGQEKSIQQEVTLSVDVEAPVEQGQVLGKVALILDGKTIGEYEITAPNEVARLTFLDVLQRMICALGG